MALIGKAPSNSKALIGTPIGKKPQPIGLPGVMRPTTGGPSRTGMTASQLAPDAADMSKEASRAAAMPTIQAPEPASSMNPNAAANQLADMPGVQMPNVKADETVQGQITGLLNKDSLYMQQAGAAGLRSAQERGLVNSSMAAGATEAARVDAALPIAAADADRYARRTELSAQFGHERALSRQGFLQSLVGAGVQGDINARLQAQQGQIEQVLTGQRIEGESRLQREGHAQTLLEQNNQGNVNAMLQAQQYGFDSRLSAQDNLQRLEQLRAQGDIEASLQLARFEHDLAVQEKDHAYGLQVVREELSNQLTLAGFEQSNVLQRMALEHEQALEQIDARFEGEFGFAMQQDYLRGSSQIQMNTMNSLQAIFGNQGLSPQQQQNAVQYTLDQMASQIQMLGNLYGQSEYFEWSSPAPVVTPPPGQNGNLLYPNGLPANHPSQQAPPQNAPPPSAQPPSGPPPGTPPGGSYLVPNEAGDGYRRVRAP